MSHHGDEMRREFEARTAQLAQTPPAKPDMVNQPPHYKTDDGIECIDAIRASLGREGFIAFCRGNAMKYIWRAGKKDEPAHDVEKAAWYSRRAAEAIQGLPRDKT